MRDRSRREKECMCVNGWMKLQQFIVLLSFFFLLYEVILSTKDMKRHEKTIPALVKWVHRDWGLKKGKFDQYQSISLREKMKNKRKGRNTAIQMHTSYHFSKSIERKEGTRKKRRQKIKAYAYPSFHINSSSRILLSFASIIYQQ